jgi:hypothetical protein
MEPFSPFIHFIEIFSKSLFLDVLHLEIVTLRVIFWEILKLEKKNFEVREEIEVKKQKFVVKETRQLTEINILSI